eukprot:CAMPEP_0184204498 /NCGR_PEP_ID=MMETSP0976-20121227/9603_1 /TAXON_ID=483370 /ORGANISM="non described non described, Strain CCMP2097" /LENGTH=137 /DNA_ID=CAMNT_0026509089 /DNA_START=143 /DNA_END=555 /DNA_ORIENTATION=+
MAERPVPEAGRPEQAVRTTGRQAALRGGVPTERQERLKGAVAAPASARQAPAKLAADWPRAVFTLAATKDDRIRVVFNAESVAREHGAGLRAYLRHVILDDRMLDRQVRFQSFDGPGADAPDDVAALFNARALKPAE